MKAIIKVVWLFFAIKATEFIYNIMLDHVSPESIYQYIIDTIPFLDSTKGLINNVFVNMNIVIYLSVLLLGFDFLDGQVKGLKAPLVIFSHTVIYFIGFSLIMMFFKDSITAVFTGQNLELIN